MTFCLGNDIGAAGAQALAEALKVNGSITTLELGGMLSHTPAYFGC